MNQFQLKLNKDTNIVLYILLSLVCMNFFHSGSIVMLVLNVYMLFYSGFILRANKTCIIYAVLTLCIMIFAIINSSVSECIKAINYVLCFLLGYDGYRLSKQKDKYIKSISFSMCIGSFNYLVLLLINNIDAISYRVLVDVWTGEYISVTLVGVITSIVLAVCTYALFFETNKKIQILSIIILIASLALNFRTATRTPFVLMMIVVIFSVLLKFNSIGNQKGKIYLLIICLTVVVLVAVIYVMDIFSLRTWFKESLLWNRFVANDSDSRIRIGIEHLKLYIKYPFGGGEIGNIVGKSAHNAIQDFYDMYGFAAGLTYAVITVSQIITLAKFLKLKIHQKYDYLLSILLFTMSVQVWTEPIVTGYPIYIWLICITHGITCARFEQVKAENYEDNIY